MTAMTATSTESPADHSLPSVDSIRQALREVIDPEVGMNIVELGLVYDIVVKPDLVHVLVTMTSPACPMGDMILDDIKAVLSKVLPPRTRLDVELTWSPPWEPSMMSEKARRHFDW